MNIQDVKDLIIDLLDRLTRDMSDSDYYDLLGELRAEIESKEDSQDIKMSMRRWHTVKEK